MKLRFEVEVASLNERLAVREWVTIAKRIAKAAKGRSPNREAQVWATDYDTNSTTNVWCGERGTIEVKTFKHGQ